MTLANASFDIRSIPTPQVYTHVVTLINRITGHEVSFKVETLSSDFCEVLREVTHQRAIRKLFGYDIYEALPCSDLF